MSRLKILEQGLKKIKPVNCVNRGIKKLKKEVLP